MNEPGYKSTRKPGRQFWGIVVSFLGASLVYYLYFFAGLAGLAPLRDALSALHELYSLLFFAPVVYAAYAYGVGAAVLVSMMTMLVMLPEAVFLAWSPGTPPADRFSSGLLPPAALGLVLSAVGATIAMLQKMDTQRQRRVKEMECLYELGKAAERSGSVAEFLLAATDIVPRGMKRPEEAGICILVREQQFSSPGFRASSVHTVLASLSSGNETLGSLTVSCLRHEQALDKPCTFVSTVADAIEGAVRRIELEQSLQRYSQELEKMVRERTIELETARDKLIRSERLAAVGELASGVGHELRNPLNVIRNCAYLLNLSLGQGADEEAVSTLKLLDRQVDISNRIVTDLLDFTRVRPPAPAPTDLNSLVRETLSWVSVPDNVALETRLDTATPHVNVDPEQLGRVFVNILANAFQAVSGKGQVSVVTGTDDGDAWVAFEDTGCGIPEESLKHIFEPLFTTRRKGIGLGLAIARRLAEQNGATINVSSQVSQGSRFTVKLKLACKDGARHEVP